MFNKNEDKLLHLVFKELNKFVINDVWKQYPDDIQASLDHLVDNTNQLQFEYKELGALYVWYNKERPERAKSDDIGTSMFYYEQDTKMLSRAVALRKFFRGLFKGGDYEPSIKTYQATQKSITKGRNVGKREITS